MVGADPLPLCLYSSTKSLQRKWRPRGNWKHSKAGEDGVLSVIGGWGPRAERARVRGRRVQRKGILSSQVVLGPRPKLVGLVTRPSGMQFGAAVRVREAGAEVRTYLELAG